MHYMSDWLRAQMENIGENEAFEKNSYFSIFKNKFYLEVSENLN